MATRQVFQEITIACDPETIFDYVADPSRWHEWFPTYQPTDQSRADQEGQHFEIRAMQRPARLLPFKLSSKFRYVVSKSDRPYLWEVVGESDPVEVITSYTLSRSEEGTVFKRHFRYSTRGWFRYVEPVLFRKRIVSQARKGLEQLKRNLESSSP